MKPFLFIIYFCFSLLAVCLTVYDKYAAKRKKARIPEKTLFITALFGGSLAMYITMLVIRHKTKHKRFMIGLPLMALAQAVLLAIIP
ncbi:MAG: DUF1294 domain-containing protein [Clostridia bacterium]|nr:DUF1294 domain-containing protein [Clostridia bacterium]